MALITLVYNCFVGNIPTANLVAKVTAIPLTSQGDLDLLGYTVNSDVITEPGSGVIRRTVVLNTTSASDSRFPTNADRIASTVNLWRDILALRIPARVTALTPVVT